MWFSKWAFASSLRFFSFVLSNSSFSNSPGGSIVGHAISQQIPCRCLAICYHLNLEQAAYRSFLLSFLLMFRFECCLCLFGNAECGTNHLKQCRCCTIQDSLPCAFLMSYCGLRVLACGTTDMCHLLKLICDIGIETWTIALTSSWNSFLRWFSGSSMRFCNRDFPYSSDKIAGKGDYRNS